MEIGLFVYAELDYRTLEKPFECQRIFCVGKKIALF